MTVATTIAGVVLIALTLRDIFHTVFHPQGRGAFSAWVQLVSWNLVRRVAQRRKDVLTLPGPIAIVTTLAFWTATLILGWALVIWPQLPDGFLISTGLDPDEQAGFIDAVYISTVALATLGLGDIAPQADWLRLVIPLEALIGFVLMTAAIAWILSIYPVLGRREGLAHLVTLASEQQAVTGIGLLDQSPEGARPFLEDLAVRVVTVRGDLQQYPVTYYFSSGDPRTSLAKALPELTRIADEASRPEHRPEVRLRGVFLGGAIADLVTVLRPMVLRGNEEAKDTWLDEYAVDHVA